MQQDVLEQLSGVIGRQVKPVAAVKPAAAPATAAPKAESLESVIGRPVKTRQLPPLVSSRLSLYNSAVKNGFDQKRAIDAAMSTAGTIGQGKPEGVMGRAKDALRGTAAGSALDQFGRMFSSATEKLNNPAGATDKEWEDAKKGQEEFFERHIGKNFAAGAASHAVEFGEEFLSPVQMALMVGTFGESALARVAAKTGIAGAVPAARTVAKLAQLHFAASMVEGSAGAVENGYKDAINGNWEGLGGDAVEGLASGLMAKGLVSHEQAMSRVRGDLEKTAREQYGVPHANPAIGAITSRFDQLDPYQQGLVIDKAVKASPEYQAVLNTADHQGQEAKDRTKKQRERKINDYYGRAIDQSWDENAAKRTIRGLQRGRQAFEKRTVSDWTAEAQKGREAQRKADLDEYFQGLREKRVPARADAAEARTARTKATQAIADSRASVWNLRNTVSDAQQDEGPTRHVEAVLNDQGQVTYPSNYWGEENSFGVASDVAGHAVYRQTPRGTEWLDANGNYSESPESLFFSQAPETADTIARLSSLSASADSAADAEGATEAHKKEAEDVSAIRRDLVSGEIDAKEAQKRAGIADKVKLSDEFVAAQDGKLNGPFHESSQSEYFDQLAEEYRKMGATDEEIEMVRDNAGALAVQQTQGNLDHVYRPGDYIVSKNGVTWTLDSKGMIHPSDGGQPVPLMKNGLYSNQSMQLASSGRIGYGTKTREERRSDAARRRSIEEELRNKQDEVQKEMRLSVQREGLQPAAETEPRADLEEKAERRQRFMSRPPRAPESGVGQVVRMVFGKPADANGVLQSIADKKGVSVEEVMRLALASDPDRANTTEAKVARLEPGDQISDPFRKDRPWKVEEGKDGNLYLRSGNANPLPLDRLNPSDRVRKLVEQGTVTNDKPEFTADDVSRAAFDVPHFVRYQEDLASQVQDRMEGKVRDPEPQNEEHAKAMAQEADRRSTASESVATRAVIEAVDVPADTAEQAETKADKANETVKVAQEAYAQAVEAKGKTEPQGVFPQRAPVTIGLRGTAGVISQNNREIPFHYELLPLDGIVTSHVWQGSLLVDGPDYPSEMQPRTISEAESKQSALRAERRTVDKEGKATGYNFAEYADPTISGQMGPAIVEQGGRVVGGNTRIAIMRRHLQNLESISDPEAREAALMGFRGAMRVLAEKSGIPQYPNDGKMNVVVRMMDNPIEDSRQAADLGRLFNKSVSVQITMSARGVSYAKSFDEPLLVDIGKRIEAHDGLVPAMQADPEFFRDIVTSRFGVDPTEFANWFVDDPSKGQVLNDQGRDQFVKALLGTVIRDTSVLGSTEGTTPYRAVERALTYVMKLKTLPDMDISAKIVEALTSAVETKETDDGLSKSRDKWAATYRPDQQSLAGMELQLPPEPDRVTEAIWRAMHKGPRTLNDRLKSFIGDEGAEIRLFDQGKETPAESFNRAFSRELAEVENSRGDKHIGIPQDEFEQALKGREFSDIEREEAVQRESQEQPRGDRREESPEQTAGGIPNPPVAKGMERPPEPPSVAAVADKTLAKAKAEQGYVTPQQLREFLETHPATKDNAPELYRTAQSMAEYVYDADPPVGVDRKQALEWVLRERLAGIEKGELRSRRGQYADPNLEKGLGEKIMKLHKSADGSTFIHEFAHVIFPMLSDQDLKDIDSIGKDRVWDGHRQALAGKVYAMLSEKLTHGLEKFLRDENPTGFTHEMKAVLAKVKGIMRKVYMKFAGDPLSEYRNTEESREVFSKMFGITDFDIADSWKEEVKKARAEESKIKRPEQEPHPLTKMAAALNSDGIRKSISGSIEDSIGERIDPKKPTAVLHFATAEDAISAWAKIGTKGSKIENAELVKSPEGDYGIKFNTKAPVPGNVLYQDLPSQHPGVRLEDLEKRMKETPSFKMLERKLIQLQIDNLKKQIRDKFGAESPAVEPQPDLAAKTLQEVKSGRHPDSVRGAANGLPGDQKSQRPAGIPKPPVMGLPNNAGAAKRGGDSRKSVAGGSKSLNEVTPVSVEPLKNERGTPVGKLAGDAYDAKKWVESLKKAGLPEGAPPPTVTLDRTTAEKLIFPGQAQVVQLALSALEQGDGFVIATATGSGKSYTGMGTIKEWRRKNPDTKVLFITKNTGLLKTAKGVAADSFGFELENEIPDTIENGVYGTTYQRLLKNKGITDQKWDLVMADESGEARNWYKDENKQGKLLKSVIENSQKAIYMSATPFHSPTEYGYLDKLGLWPKGQFDKWIEGNFAHEKVDDKIVAKLDPGKQAKLRQQLIDRGQLVSQAISYEGFTAHFGVVPVTDQMKRGLDRVREGFQRAKSHLLQMGKKGLAEKASAFEATYTKAFLERERIPQAVELARRARAQGWRVAIFSETSSEDLFRRPQTEGMEPSTYQQLDAGMGGQLSRIIPPFENVYDRLRSEFGEDIGDYSGRGNSMAEREKAKDNFLTGKAPMLYTTYAAGGIGISLHDTDGDKPTVAIFLGPPYSGVLLEQAVGRPWRFGVKSDVHAVFLATDSEPDIRLMQTKVGPRMKALRAAVLGESDSLASAMSSYTDEEKVRARQDALAYAEGDEVKVNASSFQVRSKSRNVGINDWSTIQFPTAESAKNKGMKYGEEVKGGDWTALYQSKFGLQPPESPEDAKGNSTVDGIGNGLASGHGLPDGVSVQNLDPADRDVVTGAATAAASEEVGIEVDRDKGAAARQSMQAQLNLPGDKNKWILTWPKDAKNGVWKYTGNPEDLRPTGNEPPPLPKDINTFYMGNIFTQEIGIKAISRKAGAGEAGDNIVRMNRSYQADRDRKFSQFSLAANDIMARNKVDQHDPKTMAEVYDVVQGKWSSTNPAINKAASEISQLMGVINDDLASAGVKIKVPTGEYVEFSEKTRDKNYMPHRIDWNAKVEDPLTGETHTLREVMGKTFAEQKRERIIRGLAAASGGSYEEVMDYLRNYSPSTPVLGHIHRARTMNFPIIKKDWSTLMTYFDQAAEGIAVETNFGSDRGKLNKEINRIPSTRGRATIKSMFDAMLEPQDWSDASSKFYNAMIGYEAAAKMTLSAAKVPYHLAHAPLVLGGRVAPVIKAFAHAMMNPKSVMENATYVGTVARQLNVGDLIGNAGEKSLAHEVFQKTMFNAFYKWGRAIAGESARVWMEQYAMNDLKKGGAREAEARRMLRDTMLVGDNAITQAVANGKWGPDELGKAQTAFSNFTMFSDNSLQMPGWARLEVKPDTPSTQAALHRALRLTYALQSFSLKTTSILREKLWDEVMIHHNYKPLAYAMVAYPIVGEMIRATSAGVKGGIQAGVSGAQAKITGHGQKKEDAWDKYFADLKSEFGDGPVGVLKRYIDDATFGIAWDRTRRLSDPLLNLAMGKGKLSRSEFMYLMDDEVEQDVGAAWSTLVLKPIELMAQEGMIASGKKTPERGEKEEKKLLQFLFDEVPVSKEWPELQSYLHPKKQSAARHHYY